MQFNYSEKQFLLINFLLQRLNFDMIEFEIEDDSCVSITKPNFTSNYFISLQKSFRLFKNIGDCEKIEINHKGKLIHIPKDGLPTNIYMDNGKYFEIGEFNIITFLKLEVYIKSNKKYSLFNNIRFDFITATDISNYTYCPVNYSISKTMKYKTLESALIGTEKHEKSEVGKLFQQNNSGLIVQNQVNIMIFIVKKITLN